HGDHAGWRAYRLLGYVLQHLFHVPEPDRQRYDAAGLVPAQRLGLVEADPGDRYQRRLVTGEPGVHELVGGAGFPRQIDAREARGARSRAVAHHVLHHVVHDERVARIEDAQRLIARALRVGERELIAAVIDDLLDEVRLDEVPAVREYGIGARQLPRGDRPGAKRHRQVGRMPLRVEAEAGD